MGTFFFSILALQMVTCLVRVGQWLVLIFGTLDLTELSVVLKTIPLDSLKGLPSNSKPYVDFPRRVFCFLLWLIFNEVHLFSLWSLKNFRCFVNMEDLFTAYGMSLKDRCLLVRELMERLDLSPNFFFFFKLFNVSCRF